LQEAIARMGEVVFSSEDRQVLRALGLGSCIGLCVYDPVVRVGCVAHIVLPEARAGATGEIGKYADMAVPYVIEQMTERGAVRARIRAAIAGGAQLFAFEGAGEHMDIGKRNADAVKQLLVKTRTKLVAEDTGGKQGRTVTFDAATGTVTVRTAGGPEGLLADLAKRPS